MKKIFSVLFALILAAANFPITAMAATTYYCDYCGKPLHYGPGSTVSEHLLQCTSPTCGKYSRYLPHKFETTSETAPTCGTNGKKVEKCTDCDYETTTVIPATGEHVYRWRSGVMPPEPKDRHWQECNNCGKIINIGSHVYDPVSCTASSKECKLCFARMGITPIGHYWEDKEGKAPTCEDDGFTAYKQCKRCQIEENKVTIDAIGHNFDTGIVSEKPTCTEYGVKTYTCQNDPTHTTTEPVDPTGHNWDLANGVITKKPTCTEFGEKTYTCLNDPSHTKTENVNPTGHKWDLSNGVITLTPTCTEYGAKTYTCLNNPEHTTTEPINPTDHKYDLANGKITTDPTCTEYGVKTYTCLNNPDHITTEPVNPLGHNMSTEWEYDADSHWKKCLNAPCDHTEDKSDHAATGWSKDTNGHWHQCDVCGKKLDETVPHNYSNWVVVQKPTCEKAEIKERTCKDCGWVDAEEAPALPHTYDDKGWVTDQEASCTTAGSEHRLCTVCKVEASRETKEIPATGHKMGAWYKTEDGKHHRRECQNVNPAEAKAIAETDGVKCSYFEEDEHTWKLIQSHNGHKDYVCELCGAEKTLNFYHPHYWGSNPKTGDYIMIAVIVMVFAATGLAGFALYGVITKAKKKN